MSDSAAKKYLPIRIGSLAGDEPTTFDTYIKIGDRFVLYCRNGQIFGGDRLDRLKEKNIEQLHIQQLDQMQYHLYLQRNLEKAYGHDKSVPMEIRAKIVVDYNCDLIDHLLGNLEDEDVYRQLRDSSTKYVEFICNEEEAFAAIMHQLNTDATVSLHGARVGALAISLAENLKLVDSNRPVHLLALGCFIHDLEHAHSGFAFNRPLSALTKDEQDGYRKHPMEGGRRLQELKFVDALVTQIVVQHEELMDGSGFPKGLKEDEMDPLVMVAGVANTYDRLVTFENMAPKDALKHLLIDKMGVYPLPYLQALQDLLKSRNLIAEPTPT